MDTFNIQLNDLIFYAYHGFFEEEKITGNEFVVNAVVTYTANPKTNTQKKYTLDDVIDYAKIYEIIKEHMSLNYDLLENLLIAIVHSIKEKFSNTIEVKMEIKKIKPVIEGMEGSVGIGIKKKF